MKNNKLIGIILALLVCFSVIVSVSAATESDVIFTMGSSDPMANNEAIGAIVAAPEASFFVTVDLEKNAGLISVAPVVKYDATALELVNVTVAQGIEVIHKDVEGGKQLIVGDFTGALQGKVNPSTYTGNVAVLEFKALATETDKNTEISMELKSYNTWVSENVNVVVAAPVKVNITSAAHKCTETITVNDKAATCTEVGATGNVHCAQCGALITASEEIPALGHKYNLEVEGEITKKPDCLNTGIMVYCCLNDGCNETKEVEMPVAHEAIVPVAEKAATCFAEGYTAGTKCEKCGQTLTGCEKLEKVAHTYDNGVETKAPTCTADGIMTFTCTVEGCGASYTEVINATGHSFAPVEAVAATCEKAGFTAGSKCACGLYETEPTVVEALGHNTSVATTAATCTEDGKEVTTCSRCDYKSEVVLNALGHKYTVEVTYAGCETEGFSTYTCSECDDQYVDGKVAATGHKYGAYQVVTPATRTEEGKEEASCVLCNAVDSRVIEPLGGIDPVIIVVIVVVVLAGVAVGVYFILKSKKAKN